MRTFYDLFLYRWERFTTYFQINNEPVLRPFSNPDFILQVGALRNWSRVENRKLNHTVRREKNKNPSRYLPKLNQQDKRLFDCPQKKPLIPSDKELLANASSRSAKLRYVIRNNNKFIFPEEFLKKFQNYIDIENIGLKLWKILFYLLHFCFA